ncbi:single-stranded DNA-binding protein [Quadrisphaera sp. DSM 44207]|uniref:single-stranded DNA-binding protein n=1 Tax=Quadrisphaera sp. DSM 44207 TaxID=1881057 RepID=UPI000882C9A4|nr:single-stranded DNA-binding protein [Quadrisphaera sp. DSM 44207]SDQ04343.1 single-strand DNA-binding protein [Quadrisphaera sp. DSM 44207]
MSTAITLVGNLVDDPELRFTPSGAPVATFRLAVNERRQNPQTKEWEDAGASFYRVSGWRSMAENVSESLRRGTRVIVVGDLMIRQYDKQDGRKGVSPEITARSVGPDLSFATAAVTKKDRSEQRPEQAEQRAGGRGSVSRSSGPAVEDLWSSASAPAGADDQPPY